MLPKTEGERTNEEDHTTGGQRTAAPHGLRLGGEQSSRGCTTTGNRDTGGCPAATGNTGTFRSGTKPDTVSDAAQEQPQKEKAPQTEAVPQATQPLEPVKEPTPSEDIPSETVHAKTGYVEPEPTLEPEPTPEPTAPADRQAAIDEANAYAATQYGVTTDSSLTLGNSAYRFPAAVPVDASQETLEAKARDMVDFTFRQLMMQAGRDSVADAGFHCNVCIVEDGGSLLIYVLYDG